MPIYKLQIEGTDSGKLQVNNAGGSISWSYKAPSDNGFNNLSPQPTYTGSNAMNPSVGDTLNISACTAISNAPAGNGTYTAQYGNQKAGYYCAGSSQKSLTASAGGWDAEDTGGGR